MMIDSPSALIYQVREVHNFGGFFGGDTVTLTATPASAPDDEQTLTIDERAFSNVCDRYTVSVGMLLALTFAGDRIDRAELLAAATREELRAALGPVSFEQALDGLRVLSYRCDSCAVWVAGASVEGACRLCGLKLS